MLLTRSQSRKLCDRLREGRCPPTPKDQRAIQMNFSNLASTAIFLCAGVCSAVLPDPSVAQPAYDTGASDTEIRIGSTQPYSGPASSFGTIGKVQEAYFKMLNERGGIGGRKIIYISYDDAFSPPKTVEQTRKLVEGDEVLFIFSPLGTAPNSATQKYLSSKKVPQLFVASGATKWGNPKEFPWTMGYQPPYQAEGRIFARYILAEKPDAKIGVLYQNDDFGKDLLKGLKDGLSDKASLIVSQESYEISEPTIDSHILKLRAAGVDTIVNFSAPKFTAQSIKKVAELGWQPLQITNVSSISTTQVMKPAGYQNAQGVVSAAYAKDGSDPQWSDDPGMKTFYAFLEKYAPGVDRNDSIALYGYNAALTLQKVLEQCGDVLTRENVMRQAANLKDYRNEVLLPAILINTSQTDFYPIEKLRMMRFKGETWELFGDVIDAAMPGEVR
jgi:branched-chain amino acid transport system substrate-binding protein